MKRFFKLAALPAFALAAFSILPVVANAGAGATFPTNLPPTADTGECQTATRPTPPPDAVNPGPLPGTGTTAWVQANQATQKGEAGIKGDRGYLVVRGTGAGPTVTLQGYQNESDLNGNASVTPNGASKANVCLSAQNQRVRIAVP